MRRRNTPEVNAGSMADIAFLLLIFFLVTTTIDKDKGIARQLPRDLKEKPKIEIKQKNLLEIVINANNEILVETDRTFLSEIRKLAIAFIDNGGTPQQQKEHCNYCQGNHDILSSDNPQKAIISMAPDRLTSYETYIKVQNEISSAYIYLRDRESERLFGFKFSQVDRILKQETYKGDEEKVRSQLQTIREMYPMLISEAETKNEFRL